MRFRSGETLEGMASSTGNPSAAPSMASAMPVLPLVASSSVFPGPNFPSAWTLRTIDHAARSFTLPPGLSHSALASKTTPSRPRTAFLRRMSGVSPIRAVTDKPSSAVAHYVCIDNSCRSSFMRLGHLRRSEVKGGTGTNSRVAICNVKPDQIVNAGGLVGELYSCRGAQLSGTSSKGATTMAWIRAIHTASIEGHRTGMPEERAQHPTKLLETEGA